MSQLPKSLASAGKKNIKLNYCYLQVREIYINGSYTGLAFVFWFAFVLFVCFLTVQKYYT